MLRMVKVFRRVLISGGIATTHVSALEAHPQMNPAIAGFQTLLAAFCIWLNRTDLIDMAAGRHEELEYWTAALSGL